MWNSQPHHYKLSLLFLKLQAPERSVEAATLSVRFPSELAQLPPAGGNFRLDYWPPQVSPLPNIHIFISFVTLPRTKWPALCMHRSAAGAKKMPKLSTFANNKLNLSAAKTRECRHPTTRCYLRNCWAQSSCVTRYQAPAIAYDCSSGTPLSTPGRLGLFHYPQV